MKRKGCEDLEVCERLTGSEAWEAEIFGDCMEEDWSWACLGEVWDEEWGEGWEGG